MKSYFQIVLAIIFVIFLSAGNAVAQVASEGNLAYALSNYQLNKSAVDNGQEFLIRNRMDSGATWTVYGDTLILDRIGGKSFALLQRATDGAELFSTQDFLFQTGVGPRVGVVGEDILFGFDVEASYFGIDNWEASKSLTDVDGNGMTYTLFGVPTAVAPFSTIDLHYISRLHNAEINMRFPIWENVRVLGGFRYLQLHEVLDLTSTDTQWVQSNVDNNLYGGQIGLQAALINRDRFSIETVLKAGIYGNYTDSLFDSSSTGVLGDKTTHAAFVGEVGLMGIVQVTGCMSVRGGYQVMWLDGVAIASDQFQSLNPVNPKPYVGGTLLYHGAYAGVECSF